MNAPVDISNVVLKTERLIIRPWKLSDLDDFFEYASKEGVGEAAGWSHHKSKEESLEILTRFIDHKKTFALEYKGKVIGSIGVEESDDEPEELKDLKCRAIGCILSKDYWGQGLMPEAVKEVIKYCFDELKLDYLVYCHYVWNLRSKRVKEKCGFTVHHITKHETKLGTVEDTVVSILKREDYYKM